jgi:hypothetical protein
VIDASVEEDVVQQVVLEQRFLQFLRQVTETAPVVGSGTAAVRDDEAQRREVGEQVGVSIQASCQSASWSGSVVPAIFCGNYGYPIAKSSTILLSHKVIDGVLARASSDSGTVQ